MTRLDKIYADFANVPTVELKTNGGYFIEQVLENMNCSKDPKYWVRIEGTNKYLFKSSVAESWELFYPDVENPIRNTNQIYLKFLDSNVFCEQAINYKINGYYVRGREGMLAYEQYWDLQEDLCKNGLEIEGVRLTGRHYFTLNFGRIQAIPRDEFGNKLSESLQETFLSFLDHQYYLANEWEKSLLEGVYKVKEKYLEWFPNRTDKDFRLLKKRGSASVKGRRKGYSYMVDNALYAYNFTFVPYSTNYLFAYQKNQYKTTLDGIHTTLHWLAKTSEFGRRKGVLNQRDNFRASFSYTDEFGVSIESGYMSQIEAKSFKDDPFKSVGAAAYMIGVEEAGLFPNLLETYAVSIEPLIRVGEVWVGTFIVWGSAGDMEGGGSESLKKIIYFPEVYGCLSYDNIYEEQPRAGKVGWFIADTWYAPSATDKDLFLKLIEHDKDFTRFVDANYGEIVEGVDEQGNSHHWVAKEILLDKRRKAKKGSSRSYQKLISQQPLYISDAFLIDETSPFDTATAQMALSELETKESDRGIPVRFALNSAGKPELTINNALIPVDIHPIPKDANIDGCWVIYSKPDKTANFDYFRYVAAVDTIDFGHEETSDSGEHSLAVTWIMDLVTKEIVAVYAGRPPQAEEYFEQCWRGIEYYDAQLLYENNLKGLYSYFASKNKLYLLADEPSSLKDRWGYKSNNRIKGFHATQAINSYARSLINRYCGEEIVIGQELDGTTIKTSRMFTIPSKALLQQLIAWNHFGNYDFVSAFMGLMLILYDKESLVDTTSEQKNPRMQERMFQNFRHNFVKNNSLWQSINKVR